VSEVEKWLEDHSMDLAVIRSGILERRRWIGKVEWKKISPSNGRFEKAGRLLECVVVTYVAWRARRIRKAVGSPDGVAPHGSP
jgi:hypothetical protein